MKAFTSLLFATALVLLGADPAAAVEPPKDAAVAPSPAPSQGKSKKKKKPAPKGAKGSSNSLLKDEVPPAPLPK